MRRHELRSIALRLNAKDITDFSHDELKELSSKHIEVLISTSGINGLNAVLFRDKDNNFYYCRKWSMAILEIV